MATLRCRSVDLPCSRSTQPTTSSCWRATPQRVENFQGSRLELPVGSRQAHSLSPASTRESWSSLKERSSLCIKPFSFSPHHCSGQSNRSRRAVARSYRWSDDDFATIGASGMKDKFREASQLFNEGQFYACHDVLEEMWQQSQEPQRGVIHGLLQCAVAMHHLLNHNHKGAMMEFGEGLNKLRRYTTGFSFNSSSSSSSSEEDSGEHWLVQFEQDASAVLDFVYSTQLEHAACAEDLCVTMDGSKESYQLLGNFGAGEALYRVVHAVPIRPDNVFLEFLSAYQGQGDSGQGPAPRVRIPRLDPDRADLAALSW